jgi:UDP-3-O-[3-hydroxymyristoyl] glucosamine N-acyltransferase
MSDAAKPGDPRFFARTGPHGLGTLAALAGAETAAPEKLIFGVAPLQTAGPDDISFLDNRRYAGLLAETKAGAVIVHPDFGTKIPAGAAALITPEPYVAWAKITALFHPFPAARPGIHPSAIIDPAARIAESAEIGPGTFIGPEAEIGDGSIIGPLSVIEAGVVIGKNCRVHGNVTISHAMIGDRVTIYPGARIGQDGFGFAIGRTGFTPVRQLGRVLIGHGAEIGANSCIDRGSAQDTVIGPGVHIDNLVQIAHNVTIGAHSVIVAQVGISGSTSIGEAVQIAGQAGLIGHLRIGKGAKIAAQSGVMTDIPAGAEIMGSPSQPIKTYLREVATLRKLARPGRKPNKTGATD